MFTPDTPNFQSLMLMLDAAHMGWWKADFQACIEADVNFHIALAEATHNEILCELYRSTAAHLKKRFSNIYRDTECLLATQPTHGQLLGYILAGDVRNAREAITRILEEP